MLNEFIEAYSDDQCYLEVFEELIESSPRESVVPERIKCSALCRLWAVMMIGAVECMIKAWAEPGSELEDLKSYLARGDNDEKIDRLKGALAQLGINIDAERFEDYLAAKYIRNTYIHSGWNEKQKAFVVSRDFPESLMHFDANHLARIKGAYLYILNCLGQVKAAGA